MHLQATALSPCCQQDLGRHTYPPNAAIVCHRCGEILLNGEDGEGLRTLTDADRERFRGTHQYKRLLALSEEVKGLTEAMKQGPHATAECLIDNLLRQVELTLEETAGHVRTSAAFLALEACTRKVQVTRDTLASLSSFIDPDFLSTMLKACDDSDELLTRRRSAIQAQSKARNDAIAGGPALLDRLPKVRHFVLNVHKVYYNPAEEKGFPSFFLFDQTGHLNVVETLGLDKQQAADAVRQLGRKLKPVAAVMVCEMWCGQATTPAAHDALVNGGVSLADVELCRQLGIERQEHFAVTVETVAGSELYRWPIDPVTRQIGEMLEPLRMESGGRFEGIVFFDPATVN